ncbi:MAG: IS4 family transposase [Methanosarcinaceae archaeon]|nr:IS4 family transposase [Methanosarcinaceae archaeon]
MIFYNIIKQISKFMANNLEDVISIISRETVEMIFDGFTQRRRKFHIHPLLQVFVMQIASGGSCRQAIARGINQGLLPIGTSPKTTAYINARSRIPEEQLKEFFVTTGKMLEEEAREQWVFENRQVKVVDGTTFTLHDTEQNQAEYSQPSGQKEGCGFPMMCASILMGLESGAIIDAATVAGTGYEHPLFRILWRSLNKGDIVLGDALYGSYAELVKLREMEVDGLFRSGTKKFKVQNAKRIGENEWLYEWHCPPSPGKWVKRNELPDSITVRVIRFNGGHKGCRGKQVTIYTTLLDQDKYPSEDLMKLYYRRWGIEVAFDDIKTTMGLEMLSCKTPSGCRKELWAGLLLYNLIRIIMLDASIRHKISVFRLSFAGTLHKFIETCMGRLVATDPYLAYIVLVRSIIEDPLQYRPGRVEPRKLKRRPKRYSLMAQPREIERQLIKIGYTA